MPKLFANCAFALALSVTAFVTASVAAPGSDAAATSDSAAGKVESDGTVIVPSFRLPPSDYNSDQAKARLPRAPFDMFETLRRPAQELIAMRNQMPKTLEAGLTELKRAYGVTTREGQIAGVPAVWARPAAGVAPEKSGKLLLNLPGGGFLIANAGGMGMLESIPLVGRMGVEIVSITYRQGPEARYPAATEDAVKVYREILRTHKPGDVVIFGCSAGGLLTAQTTAALVREKLPLPAAIGILCASADMRLLGDSAAFAAPFHAVSRREIPAYYYAGVDLSDPAVSPILAPDVLKYFPPTLLLTSGRARELSSAMATDIALQKAGAISQLNLWDGLDHAFFYDPALPESGEAFDVMARFFSRHLKLSR